MRVVLVSPCNQAIMPYLRHYEEVFERHSIPYDLIYWDRLSLDEPALPHYHCFHWHAPGGGSLPATLWGYLRFRRFATRTLARMRQAHPGTVVVCLNTQTAVLLGRVLHTVPYLVDIRDYTHENLPPYRRAAWRAIRLARLATVSSEGFRAWLPPGVPYVLSPNVGAAELRRAAAPWPAPPWRFACIGAVRNARANAVFLDAFFAPPAGPAPGGDAEVHFIGGGVPGCEEALRAHCRRHGYRRVRFAGRYRPEQQAGFYDECHFVLGVYGRETPFERTLTPNRLYQAAIHERPIVVSDRTHLAGLVAEHRLGVVFRGDAAALWRDLAAYADERVRAAHRANCRRFLDRVAGEIQSRDRRLLDALLDAGQGRPAPELPCHLSSASSPSP
jgi:hypothetical protein